MGIVGMLDERFPQAAELLADVGPDILAFTAFSVAHSTQVLSKFRENVRLSVQQECHSVKPQWYQMMTLRKPRGIVALADPQRPCIS